MAQCNSQLEAKAENKAGTGQLGAEAENSTGTATEVQSGRMEGTWKFSAACLMALS